MSETDDPRRQLPITVQSQAYAVNLYINGQLWSEVEWSEKRQTWCIQDAEGRCLSHHSHIHAQGNDRDGAIALAEAMIRDGRMPTPEDATKARKDRIARGRERRAKQPSEIRRRAAEAERNRLMNVRYEADLEVRRAEGREPLHEVLADALDFDDPELWQSNSFARLRDRLIVHVRAAIADLEYAPNRPDSDRRLARAREILKLLSPDATAPPLA